MFICIYIDTSRVSLGRPVHRSNPQLQKYLKFAPPDSPKMHSLVLPVFSFLCKIFSKLLKFTLQDTLF